MTDFTLRSTLLNFLSVFLPAFFPAIGFAQDGSLDLSFSSNGVTTTNFGTGLTWAHDVAVQPDGKIVVVGFASVSGEYQFAIARYNANGNPDLSFATSGELLVGFPGAYGVAYAVAIREDGKIMVGGGADVNPSDTDFAILRLNSDGSFDNTFGSSGITTTDFGSSGDYINDIVILEDGKIIVGGSSGTAINGNFAVARYHSNGTLDATFGTGGSVITDFAGSNEGIAQLAIQDDGKIIAGGLTYVTNLDFAMMRYESNGAIDGTFGTGGIVIYEVGVSDDYGHSLELTSDGKIIMGGSSHSSPGGPGQFSVAKFNSDGTPDLTFSSDGKVQVPCGNSDLGWDVLVQPDGKIVVCGQSYNGLDYDFGMIRVTADGSVDNTFGSGGTVMTDFGWNNYAYAITQDAEGRFVVVGSYEDNEFQVARYFGNTVGLDESPAAPEFSIYPNPTSGQFSVTPDQTGNYSIRVLNLTGQVLIHHQNVSGSTILDMAGYADGIYFVEVQAEGVVKTQKLVKQ